MRLLYLTRSYNVHDRRFVSAFDHHGLITGVLSLQDASAGIARLRLPQSIHHLGNLGLNARADTNEIDRAVPRFLDVLDCFQPDLVIAGPVHDSGYLAAKSRLDVPWLMQCWASDVFWESEQDLETARRAAIALVDCPILFADCDAVVARCEQLAGKPVPEHFVIPWGIALEEIKNHQPSCNLRREFHFEGTVLFLCTRALEPVYQIETLLESFAECHKRNPRAALLLASDGSRRQWVDGFVQRHNLETVVAVTGTLDHDVVLDCFAQADCYVSCAACDGASISLLEAMAFGLPSIVTDLPGNREWIRPGTNGWLAPLNDVHEFANGMIEAAALKLESRNQIADVSKNIVSAKADWCANSETFIRFLSKCVADSSAKHKTRSPTLGGTCRR